MRFYADHHAQGVARVCGWLWVEQQRVASDGQFFEFTMTANSLLTFGERSEPQSVTLEARTQRKRCAFTCRRATRQLSAQAPCAHGLHLVRRFCRDGSTERK